MLTAIEEQMLHLSHVSLQTAAAFGGRRANGFSEPITDTPRCHTRNSPHSITCTEMLLVQLGASSVIRFTLVSTCSRHRWEEAAQLSCCQLFARASRWRRCLQPLTRACVSLPTGCLFQSELCSSHELCVNGKTFSPGPTL